MLRLRVSLALLLTKGDQLTTTFYALLFERYPAVRRLFPARHGSSSSRSSPQTLAWIVTHLDRRDEARPGRPRAGPASRRIRRVAEHYPLVRDTLIDAMARTAGADWDDEPRRRTGGCRST